MSKKRDNQKKHNEAVDLQYNKMLQSIPSILQTGSKLDILISQRTYFISLLSAYNYLLNQRDWNLLFNDGERNALKKSINNTEKQIKKLDDLIKQEERSDVKQSRHDMREEGFRNGIDTTANILGEVGGMVGTIGQTATSLATGIPTGYKRDSKGNIVPAVQLPVKEIVILGGLVAVLLIFSKK